MTKSLTLKSSTETWYPNSIGTLKEHISSFIVSNTYFSIHEVSPIQSNIAYSLQYIEFLCRVIEDINLSSVLYKQNVKSIVVYGASIIESILNYLVITEGYGKTTNLKSVNKYDSKEYSLSEKNYKNTTEIFEKLDEKIPVQMTFDKFLKKVESKKLLGDNLQLYKDLNFIRQLRNKIHIHDSGDSYQTDYDIFDNKKYILIQRTLLEVLTSCIFDSSIHLDKFEFLKVKE